MSHWIGTTSPSDAGMNDFKECLKFLRDGRSDDALLHARRALGVAPKILSIFLIRVWLAALSEKRFGDAESLCREALGMKHNHAQLYLNLAEVYYQAGRTSEAIVTLEKGLVSAGRDFRIRRALEKIGVRRLPVVTFLHRSHPVNRALGKWRHRLTGPYKAALSFCQRAVRSPTPSGATSHNDVPRAHPGFVAWRGYGSRPLS